MAKWANRLLTLSIADIVITSIGAVVIGPQIEINPLMLWFLSQGVFLFAFVKLFICSSAIRTIQSSKRSEPILKHIFIFYLLVLASYIIVDLSKFLT